MSALPKHPYNTPLKVDGENLSFLDPDTGEVHVCDGSGLQINGEQLCYKEKETKDSSLDAIDLSEYAVGATGTMQATAKAYYETLSRKQKHVLAENFKQKISSVGKAELVKTSTIKSVASTVLSAKMARGLGYAGLLVIAIDINDDQEIRVSHVLNAGMVAASFFPVVGWMIGGSYFIADIATLTITGKSIGEHADTSYNEYFDKPLDTPLKSWKD